MPAPPTSPVEPCGKARDGRRVCPSYLAPYQEMVDRFGPCFEALMWNSPETQGVRFQVISEMLDLTGHAILDAGCGRADFLKYLRARSIALGRYVGIDGVPELLDVGRAIGDPRAEFHQGDFVTDPAMLTRGRPDVIVFSGSLNTIEQTESLRVLDAAWQSLSARGSAFGALVFNFLSDRHTGRIRHRETGPALRFDTQAMIAWSLARTPRILVRQDYLGGNDATIVMMME